jgi:hypothetical protein
MLGWLKTRAWVHYPPVISASPALYYPYLQLVAPRRYKAFAVSRDTELVVEGPHRSANTFVASALRRAAEPAPRMALHCHVAAQVIRAVRWGIPAVVMLRQPEDAVRSHIVFNWNVSVRQGLGLYRRFYAPLWPYREGFLVVRFEDAVADINGVAERINARFGMLLEVPPDVEAPSEDFKSEIDSVNRSFGRDALFRSFFPNPVKEAAKAKVELDPGDPDLLCCQALYRRFLSLAGPAAAEKA